MAIFEIWAKRAVTGERTVAVFCGAGEEEDNQRHIDRLAANA